jgi:alkylated DNA repair dioxygenase AlkB
MSSTSPYAYVPGRGRVWRPEGRAAQGPSPALQGSLLDLADEPAFGPLGASVARRALSAGAWVDRRPGWVTGAAALFDRLRDAADWQAERRQMYDRVVDVPRLNCYLRAEDLWPDPFLRALQQRLNEHYSHRDPFVTCGMAFYRDGRDSVAWHGDTFGRGSTEDVMVAIVSVGEPRAFLLRPRTGHAPAGPTIRYDVGHGDLLVMGGSAQRTWEHAVPKSARPVGPRISIQFRPREVA